MIKAIETRYAGCHFRSRLEARWAVFFDHMEIAWEYEPEAFETSAGNYLPDFRIESPGYRSSPCWFEVKPDRFISDARHAALVAGTGNMPFIVAAGMPRDYRDQLRGAESALKVMFGYWERQGGGISEAFPCAFVGVKRARPEWRIPGSCPGHWDFIADGRLWSCDQQDGVHVAVKDPHDHDHHPPYGSSDIDAAYAAARSERFGR